MEGIRKFSNYLLSSFASASRFGIGLISECRMGCKGQSGFCDKIAMMNSVHVVLQAN